MTRGSLSPVVYWRRRLVVVGVALAFLLLLVHALGGGADTSRNVARQVSAQPTTQLRGLSTRPTSGTSPGTTASKGGKAGKVGKSGKRKHAVVTGPAQAPTKPVLADPVGTCADRDVLVTPQVEDAEVGQPVPVTLLLRTRTAAACTWTASSAHLAVKVTRFGNEIWSNRLCPQQLSPTDVIVRQAVVSTLQLSWDARRAESGCPEASPWALPGRYHVASAALGAPPAKSSFALAPRTVVVITPAPDPSPSTSPSGSATDTGPTKSTTKGTTKDAKPGTNHHHGRTAKAGAAPRAD